MEPGAVLRVCGLKVPYLLQVCYLLLCLRNTDTWELCAGYAKAQAGKISYPEYSNVYQLCFNRGLNGHLNIAKIQVVLGRLMQSSQTVAVSIWR